jgi:seryl-tRNA synthetase
VPRRDGAADNQEVRRVGEPRAFDFEPKAHWDLGPALGILDFERATRMSGARFSVLMGAGARSRARSSTSCSSCTPASTATGGGAAVPGQRDALTGTGQPAEVRAGPVQDRRRLGSLPDPDGGGAAHEPPPRRDPRRAPLPLKYTAYTPCFRSEAGSYGADVRGLIRQHQFDKVELVKFTTPEQSYDELEALTRERRAVLERLELPYRTMLLCTGDMGFASAKTYDIEVWLPSQQTYREISSCSNTEAFQARRARHPLPAGRHGARPSSCTR